MGCDVPVSDVASLQYYARNYKEPAEKDRHKLTRTPRCIKTSIFLFVPWGLSGPAT